MTRARRRGTAAVEFLLVLPLFLVVFLATVAIGQYLIMEYELGNAAMVTAHRCVAYARTLRSAGVSCPALGTVADELARSGYGRTCEDVQASASQLSFGDGQRFAVVVDATCRVGGGAGALLQSGLFGVRLPRVRAHASAPLVIGP